jgi:hypothetical protein
MRTNDLPIGGNPPALSFDHFPTRQQAFVWRNWEMVPVERLAAVLNTDSDTVLSLAFAMGLRTPPIVIDEWLARGYVTLIKANWHLLPYDQLLQLLDWTPDLMDYMLKEEDFLFIKLGCLKPKVDPLRYRPLTAEEKQRTEALRGIVEQHFAESAGGERPFAFLEQYQQPTGMPAPSMASEFDLRLLYDYAAPYGDTLLDDPAEMFPEGLFEQYRALGVNGIWLQSILYTLVPFPGAETAGKDHETRIANLRKLTEIAARYDVGIYLYFNEPRAMAASFFDAHPDWRGVQSPHLDLQTWCTSSPGVLKHLHTATATLFRGVPELAGVFTITMSENLTNCISRPTETGPCPKCSKRNPADIIAEVNNTIESAVHSVRPTARVIAWAWGWGSDWARDVIDQLNPGVEFMAKSEEELPVEVGGIKSIASDYTLSQVGPSDYAREHWEHARGRGLKTHAKMQWNLTWECSALPYLPVLNLLDETLRGVREAGVNGVMMGWTLGGCPSPNLELASKPLDLIARDRYGESAAPVALKAWEIFSEAFREFPFSIGVVYGAPCNVGCMNLLYAENTGYIATMVGIAYDDLEQWRDIYPEEIFEEQFRKLTDGWREGLAVLETAEQNPQVEELRCIAEAGYCHFRSVYNQIRFVRRRNKLGFTRDDTFREILDEEIDLAKRLLALTRQDSRIGFEASNHYFYTPNDLREKVLNCEYLLAR